MSEITQRILAFRLRIDEVALKCTSASRPVDKASCRACPNSPQSSSVTKGMIGCRSTRHWSSAQAIVAFVSCVTALSSLAKSGFETSRYQSQKVPQTKA